MLKGSLFVYCFVVPIDQTKGIKMLYEFVDIKLDAVDTVRHNFEAGKSLALVGTIQFVTTLQVCLNDYTDGTVFLFEFLTVNSYFLITSPNVMSGFITFGSAWASLGEKSVLLNIPCCGRGVTTLLYPRVSTRLLPSIENLPCLKHSEVLVRLRGPLLLVLVPSLLKLPNGRIYRVP